jgi:hypothetical protein
MKDNRKTLTTLRAPLMITGLMAAGFLVNDRPLAADCNSECWDYNIQCYSDCVTKYPAGMQRLDCFDACGGDLCGCELFYCGDPNYCC